MPSSSRLSSPSVTRHAIAMRASRSMSSPVISQSIHTSRSFIPTGYDFWRPVPPANPFYRTNPVHVPAEMVSAPLPDVLRDADARPQRGIGLRFAEPHRDRHHACPPVGRAVLRLVGRAAGADLHRGLGEREREDRGGGELFPGRLARVG